MEHHHHHDMMSAHEGMMMSNNESSSASQFCNTSHSMIMYMDGFHFTLHGNPHSPCLNLLFPFVTLDTRWKFVLAVLVVFVLAMLVEGFAKLRHGLVRRNRGMGWLRLLVTALHAFQAWMGYVLMLVTMTFSMELLLAVVLGLAVGYGVFFQRAEILAMANDDLHVTSNPCCEFMEEESREQQYESMTLGSEISSLTEGLLPTTANRPSDEEE